MTKSTITIVICVALVILISVTVVWKAPEIISYCLKKKYNRLIDTIPGKKIAEFSSNNQDISIYAVESLNDLKHFDVLYKPNRNSNQSLCYQLTITDTTGANIEREDKFKTTCLSKMGAGLFLQERYIKENFSGTLILEYMEWEGVKNITYTKNGPIPKPSFQKKNEFLAK